MSMAHGRHWWFYGGLDYLVVLLLYRAVQYALPVLNWYSTVAERYQYCSRNIYRTVAYRYQCCVFVLLFELIHTPI
jgi:hypothetical protein